MTWQDKTRDLLGVAAGWGSLAGLLTLVAASFVYQLTEVPFP